MGTDTSKDHSEQFESVRKSLNETLQDRILKILLKNSNMTRKQFESFLIDSVSESSLQRGNISRERPRLRTDRDYLSRGSFDRTLKQAGRNVVKATFTILLLGYTGLLETPQLEPFLEVGNRLRAYNELRGERSGEVEKMEEGVVSELSEILTSMIVRRGKVKNYISPH
jgi:hypothetical protein